MIHDLFRGSKKVEERVKVTTVVKVMEKGVGEVDEEKVMEMALMMKEMEGIGLTTSSALTEEEKMTMIGLNPTLTCK